LFTTCPEGCASVGRFGNQLLRSQLGTGSPPASYGEWPVTFLEQVAVVHDLVGSGSSTPRAPPASSNIKKPVMSA